MSSSDYCPQIVLQRSFFIDCRPQIVLPDCLPQILLNRLFFPECRPQVIVARLSFTCSQVLFHRLSITGCLSQIYTPGCAPQTGFHRLSSTDCSLQNCFFTSCRPQIIVHTWAFTASRPQIVVYKHCASTECRKQEVAEGHQPYQHCRLTSEQKADAEAYG